MFDDDEVTKLLYNKCEFNYPPILDKIQPFLGGCPEEFLPDPQTIFDPEWGSYPVASRTFYSQMTSYMRSPKKGQIEALNNDVTTQKQLPHSSHTFLLKKFVEKSPRKDEKFDQALIDFLIFVGYPYPGLLKQLNLQEKIAILKLHLRMKKDINAYELVKNYYSVKGDLFKKIDLQLIEETCSTLALVRYVLTDYIDLNAIRFQFYSFDLQCISQLVSDSKVILNRVKDLDRNSVGKLAVTMDLQAITLCYFRLLLSKDNDSLELFKMLAHRLSIDLETVLQPIGNLIIKLISQITTKAQTQEKLNDGMLLNQFCGSLEQTNASALVKVCMQMSLSYGFNMSHIDWLVKIISLHRYTNFNVDNFLEELQASDRQNFPIDKKDLFNCIFFFVKKFLNNSLQITMGLEKIKDQFYSLLRKMDAEEVCEFYSEIRFYTFTSLDLVTFKNLIVDFYREFDETKYDSFQLSLNALNQPRYLNQFIQPVLNKMKSLLKTHCAINEDVASKSANTFLLLFYTTLSKTELGKIKLIYNELRVGEVNQCKQDRFILNILLSFFEYKNPNMYTQLITADLQENESLGVKI